MYTPIPSDTVYILVCVESSVVNDLNKLENAVSKTLAEYDDALDEVTSLHSPHDSIAWKDENRKAQMAKEINMGRFSQMFNRAFRILDARFSNTSRADI